MMAEEISSPRRTFVLWLKGAVLGAATGILALMGPTLGFALALVGFLLSLRDRPRFWSSSGILIGAGFVWLILIWLASSACRTIETPTYYADCRPPDITPYVTAALAFIVAGSAMLFVASVRQRRAYRRPRDGDSDAIHP
jgi:hypothetical protein